jgi:hypothetical protein
MTFDVSLIYRSSAMLNVSSPAVIIKAAEGARKMAEKRLILDYLQDILDAMAKA